MACNNGETSKTDDAFTFVTLDPGHFHAALVQKSMYPDVDSNVYVYAPDGPDLQLHLNRIEAYNIREEEPTHWKEHVYTGTDFFQKMVSEKKGNIVIMAGNNQKKTEYIYNTIDAGMNVLADKPMAINSEGFELLKSAFEKAGEKNVLLYDIMTERFEINSILQREFSLDKNLFGELEKGSLDDPAITKESVHYFYKTVSGSTLQRPPWFMDVEQEGEGIVDVTTHLVDLAQWACFPNQVLDYTKDVEMVSAKRWPTTMTLTQFGAITKHNSFPDYLRKDLANDTTLNVYSNGEINYKLRGVHVKVSVIWGYKAPEGTGDTHYSIMRGTRANLVIRQGAAEGFKPILYIEPVKADDTNFEEDLNTSIATIQANYPGVEVKKSETGWQVIVPEKYHVGHEAHFAQVTENYLKYLKEGKLPDWEVPNMITKYYITTSALDLAKISKAD
ncbi:MAG TPA: putative oxidoreductase C-terminal domain-containing protein [Sphingobacterium sp.]|nr:putative oxidoreductase C-terminal domain-containing protein [Sphingobacterium sp.]